MCGILGVIGGNIALGDFLYGLELLSTRGQEAAGITGFVNGLISEKCQGTATNLGKNLPERSEIIELCIGSTRYPTIGSLKQDSLYHHLAPFTESTTKGLLSLAFNGNIIYPRVNGEGNDGRLLTKLIKNKIDKGLTLYEVVKTLMEEVDGAYSAIAMLGDDQLIAIRDPNGLRPLCWGTLSDGGFVVASETRILSRLGITEFNFIPPGGMFIFRKGSYEKHRIVFRPVKHCMFEWTYFSQAPSIIDGIEVYQARYNLGIILAKLMQQKGISNADYVIPVPNTSRSSAVGCADYLGIKYADGLIKNKTGRIFIKPTKKARAEAVSHVYETVNSVIKNKKIILIDDSIVRGTTLSKVIALLKDKGAKEIHVGIPTPMIKFPCPYGIDMSRPGELLAASKNEEQIKDFLGCDSLTYMTLEGLIEGIGSESLCMACLDGNYPTKKAKLLFENIHSLNDGERYYEQDIISG